VTLENRPIQITEFDPTFNMYLPKIAKWLTNCNLNIHPSVELIVLHGSRGLSQNYRSDSDIDLSLLVPFSSPPAVNTVLENTLREVAEVTENNWNSSIQLDLAIVFPRKRCDFTCFRRTSYD
jgi:hypothetical protein